MGQGIEAMREQADVMGATVGKAGVFGGSASAFVFGMTASEFAALSGVAIALLGLLVQFYYNRRKDRRDTEEHEARMARYREELDNEEG